MNDISSDLCLFLRKETDVTLFARGSAVKVTLGRSVHFPLTEMAFSIKISSYSQIRSAIRRREDRGKEDADGSDGLFLFGHKGVSRSIIS